MEWDQLAAELTNKFRWALGTSTGEHFNLSYREQLRLATTLAGDCITFFKLKEEKPNLEFSPDLLRAKSHRNGKVKTS